MYRRILPVRNNAVDNRRIKDEGKAGRKQTDHSRGRFTGMDRSMGRKFCQDQDDKRSERREPKRNREETRDVPGQQKQSRQSREADKPGGEKPELTRRRVEFVFQKFS